jgi:hypothetical protein
MQPDLDPRQGGLAHLLRALPREALPPYGYHEFERRAQSRARDLRGRLGGQRLAAAAVIGVGALAVLVRLSGPALPIGHGSVPGAVPPARVAPGPEDDSLPPGAGATQRWLERLPSEPAVVHVGTRAAVMGLEDRIAQVDDLLSAARGAPNPRRLATLQQERARLVDTLLQVRYAETLANATP